ncbi:hypothetical protein [Thermosulfurimonas sp. F29]|uniref:hypothetical protein n=1 Tax=Thermosulfurimonas sp. F29 TaxID=2867247 RepID=UPI001C834AEE|nr:hypothetical protein [Thermosulfurimonas sp. F29]MBX6424198.1 hypothetical protein [Thermosulfurimonas sp. F29]
MLNRARYEEIALELMVSALKTRRGARVLEEATEMAYRRGKRRLAEMLSQVAVLIGGGHTLCDAFYYAGFLSEKVYRPLKVIEERNALTAEMVERFLSDLRERKRIVSGLIPTLVMPFTLMVFAAGAAVFMAGQVREVILGFYETGRPWYVDLYLRLSASTPVFFLLLLGVSGALLGISLWGLFRKVGALDFAVYRIASLVASLAESNASYQEIFTLLAAEEKGRMREILETVAEEARFQAIGQALSSFYELLGVSEALILRDYLSRGEDSRGWRYLQEVYRERSLMKSRTMAEVAPLFAYIGVAVCLAVALAPLAFLMTRFFQLF